MATGNEEIRVPIGVPVTTDAGAAASTLQGLAKSIDASKDAAKDAAAQLRSLRGSSDEVKAAKDQLKAVVDREKNAISDATLAMLKQGQSYEKVADAAKKSAEKQKAAQDSTSEAVKLLGGRAGELQSKWQSLTTLLKGANGDFDLTKVALLGTAAAAVAVGVAIVASAAAIGAGLFSLGKWVFATEDAARSQQLLRSAVTSTEADAGRLGRQIDLLASKVPTSTEELNKLAISLRMSGVQGQTLVDTLNASAQATAALGSQAGAKIDDIIKRGRLTGRTVIGRFELQGTGLDFDDIAKRLAKGTGKAVKDTKLALTQGQVSIGAAAQALRESVEAKLGSLNLRKMWSLDNAGESFRKITSSLTKGIDFEPVYKGIAQIAQSFSATSVAGSGMKDIITNFSKEAIGAFTTAVPKIEDFIQELVNGGLRIEIAYYKTKNAIKEALGDSGKNLNPVGDAFAFIGSSAKSASEGILLFVNMATRAFDVVMKIKNLATGDGGLGQLGTQAPKTSTETEGFAAGVARGIKGGGPDVAKAATDLAAVAKNAFNSALDIHSPSRVMAESGHNAALGVAQGQRKGIPAVESAADDVAEATAGSMRGAAGASLSAGQGSAYAGRNDGGASTYTITVDVKIDARGASGDVVQKLNAPETVKPMAKAIEEVLIGLGIQAQR